MRMLVLIARSSHLTFEILSAALGTEQKFNCGINGLRKAEQISMMMLVMVARSCHLTFEMLSVAFGVSTMSRTQVQLWYNRFKEGQENINDYARPGRPIMSFDF